MSETERGRLLARSEEELGRFLDGARPIIAAVKAEGDAALVRFGRDLDGAAGLTAEGLRVSPSEFAAAEARVSREVREALAFAVASIRSFHERQKPEGLWLDEVHPGVLAGEKATAIPSVACYVPRGKGAFPSVLMMTTVPARVAGVPRIVVLTPPGEDSSVDPATLVAASMIGVDEIYKVGGAQAVAAVAYGTSTVPRCAKIVGPGSPWVVAAKQLLAGRIDPGMPAGPSESIVLADGAADPRIAAMDLLIEAEHGPDSSAYLVTDSPALARAAHAALPELCAPLSAERRSYVAAVLGGASGGIVLAPDWAEAVRFVNDYAPEHLLLLTEEPVATLSQIEHAGEILLGPYTPFTLANFLLGPNAVLPTSGHARTHSPLGVHDFMKRISVAQVTRAAFPPLARHARALALYEGFEAHAAALGPGRPNFPRG
ncbi:MAG: histidinol dehydrogenase [Alphaproteobacteria bacterium]|nr:histidinol dehydrogenase [Alphaproteobacteria bacterium]